ncbi:MAG: hypothetical protein ABSH14_08410 [Verrucomicrobiia bacterium]|jgi:hypothetical protein
MTEKLNRQFAVSAICAAVENATPIYEFDVVRLERATKPRRTRDLLLPKLISGEVGVSELDIETGEEAA